MLEYLKNLLQLILSPAHAWEDISADAVPAERIAAGGFYPLTAVTALTCFVAFFYHPLTLSSLIMRAMVTFAAFFLGYFIASFAMSMFLNDRIDGEVNENRCHTFALYNLGLLELITIVGNLLPTTFVLMWFMPFYVAVVMWKACRYMRVKQAEQGRFMALAIVGVLLPPYAIMFLFNLILPLS